MDNKVLFIQIVSTKNLKLDSAENSKRKSKKGAQFKNIEKAIQDIIPLKNSNIKEYKLFFVKDNDIVELKKSIINTIKTFLL